MIFNSSNSTSNILKRNILVVFLCLNFSFNSLGQILPEWVDTIGGVNPLYSVYFPTEFKVDANGNSYVAEIRCDTMNNCSVILAKYNSAGTRLFFIDTLSGVSHRVSICIDDFQNLCVSVLNLINHQLLLLKYDASGNIVWASTDASLSGLKFLSLIKMVTDPSGNIYIAGEGDTVTSSLYNNMVTMKFNSNGIFQWAGKYYYGDGYVSIGLDANQNVYVAGRSVDSTSANWNVVVIKYNSSGVQQWAKKFNSPNKNEIPLYMTVSAAGNCYVAGWSSPSSGGASDYLTLRYDSSGNIIWHSIYDAGGIGQGTDLVSGIKIDNAENVYVSGTQFSNSSPAMNFYTLKYDSSGNVLWTRLFDSSSGSNSGETALSLCLDNLNNVYASGIRVNMSNNIPEIFTIKYDTNGDTLWAAGYNYYLLNSYSDFNCSCDALNNVYLSGTLSSSFGPYFFTNLLTLKYGFSVGISEINISDSYLDIYPNPTQDVIHINSTLNFPATEIILFDASGRAVMEKKFNKPASFSVKHLNAGIYFYNIKSAKGNEARGKMVKE